MTESWRLWFTGSLVVGAVLAPVLGTARVSGYGALSAHLSVPALVVVLAVVGLLIGYGARWAGGCTSGHGISGCSAGSPESFAATATFFLVAIAVTFGLHLVSGGAVLNRRRQWSAVVVGLAFGFFLTASGLGDYDTIHDGCCCAIRTST